jgi:arylsulfatase A-like enzyme
MKYVLLSCLVVLASQATVWSVEKQATKPNVIVILADDLGWADVGFNGSRDIPTPHLDAIAKSGVVCTSGYASHPYCSPSRAGLLTGRHQQRFGHEGNPVKDEQGLPLSETLLSQLLQQNGYRTAAIGKWHLGNDERYWPTKRGFDEWYGFSGGGLPYWGRNKPTGSGVMRNGQPVPRSEISHLTDNFSAEAVEFIDRNKDKPFFLYLAYNAPHAPDQATRAHLKKTEHIESAGRSIYAAMVAGMDEGIGRVIKRLDELQLREQTLIIFYSDNGGRGDHGMNYPYRGHKGLLFEGGIRVPYCVAWPERIPAGQTVDNPVTGLDIFPTVLAAAGAKVPAAAKLDGVNLLPHLTGDKAALPERTLTWRSSLGNDEFGYAVRDNAFKLVCEDPRQTQLFNIVDDPYEHHDVATAHPEIVERMKLSYADWAKGMQDPLWIDPHGANIRNSRAGRQKIIDAASQGGRK